MFIYVKKVDYFSFRIPFLSTFSLFLLNPVPWLKCNRLGVHLAHKEACRHWGKEAMFIDRAGVGAILKEALLHILYSEEEVCTLAQNRGG